jgi:hypothetical protein
MQESPSDANVVHIVSRTTIDICGRQLIVFIVMQIVMLVVHVVMAATNTCTTSITICTLIYLQHASSNANPCSSTLLQWITELLADVCIMVSDSCSITTSLS